MSIKCKKPLSWITYVGNLIGVSTLKHGEEEPHHTFLSPGSLILRFNQAKKKQKKSQGPTLSIMGNFHFLQISQNTFSKFIYPKSFQFSTSGCLNFPIMVFQQYFDVLEYHCPQGPSTKHKTTKILFLKRFFTNFFCTYLNLLFLIKYLVLIVNRLF